MAKQETPGEVVARLRQAKGWTPYRLAKEAGLSGPVVYRLESGERGPAFGTLQAVCKALGASLAEFDGCPLPERPG